MRPLKLTMSAFGPFAGEVEIDFERLGTEGLYLVCGDTGAGKTTIFDAISFALYGKVTSKERDHHSLRSDFAPAERPTFVRLAFEVGGRRYEIERKPEYLRPALRGPKRLVKSAAGGALTAEDGAVVEKGLDAAVARLLGMEHTQFSQIVMIAQGDFRRLLLAESKDRSAIFRRLFATEPVRTFQATLQERRKSMEQGAQGLRERSRRTLLSLAEAEEDDGTADTLEALAEMPAPDLQEAQGLIQGRRELHLREDRELEQRAAELGETRETVAQRLRDLHRSQELTDRVATLVVQETHRAQAVEAAEKTMEAVKAKGDERDRVRSRVETLTRELPDYERRDGLRAERDRGAKALEVQRKRISGIQDRLATLESRREEAQVERDGLGNPQAVLAGLQGERTHAEAQLSQAREAQGQLAQAQGEVDRLRDEGARLADVYAKAREEATAATAAWEEAESRRDDAQAGWLARSLVEGEPCPVCGSVHHPAPAEPVVGCPTEDEVERLRLGRDKALEARATASAALAQNRDALAQAEEALGQTVAQGGDGVARAAAVARCQEHLRALDDRMAEGRGAVARLATLEKALDKIVRDGKAAERDLDEARSEEAEGVRTLAVVEERLSALTESMAFADAAQCRAALGEAQGLLNRLQAEEVQAADGLTRARAALGETRGALAAVKADLEALPEADGQAMETLTQELAALDAERDSAAQGRRELAVVLGTEATALRELAAIDGEGSDLQRRFGAVAKLADVAQGKTGVLGKVDFETFVQGRWLDAVLEAANRRLQAMSEGRYRLNRYQGVATDLRKVAGLELEVWDAYTGLSRSATSLSGGESFEASLALALGLSDVVQAHSGGVRLDTMFVDEGFGTLDAEALGRTIEALTDLTGDGKLVGVISHVEEMRQAIDRKLVVEKAMDGSKVTMEL